MRFALILIVCFAFAAPILSSTALADQVAGAASALNSYRAANNRPALKLSPRLQKAAEAHAADMARNGFFSHTGSDRSTVSKRVERVGYKYCQVSENIAKGQRDLNEVMQAWANSPPHAKNMADRRSTQYGLARGPGNIWVLVMGKSGC